MLGLKPMVIPNSWQNAVYRVIDRGTILSLFDAGGVNGPGRQIYPVVAVKIDSQIKPRI